MDIWYTGRQSTITRKLKSMTEEGLEPVSKMVGSVFSVHVIFTTEKYRHCAEITLKTRTYKLVAKCESTEMVVALRDALEKVEQQAIRHKKRYTTIKRHSKAGAKGPKGKTAEAAEAVGRGRFSLPRPGPKGGVG